MLSSSETREVSEWNNSRSAIKGLSDQKFRLKCEKEGRGSMAAKSMSDALCSNPILSRRREVGRGNGSDSCARQTLSSVSEGKSEMVAGTLFVAIERTERKAARRQRLQTSETERRRG